MDRDARSVALRFQDRIGHGDMDGALALAADTAVFTRADGALLDKSGFKAQFASVTPLLAEPFELRLVDVTAQGERVAIEMTGHAPLKNGKVYDNRYHFLFVVRDGVIVEMREYCDTRAAAMFAA